MKYGIGKVISVLYPAAWKYVYDELCKAPLWNNSDARKTTEMWQELLLPTSLALQLLKGEVELIYFSL
jgi:hypothetical protein